MNKILEFNIAGQHIEWGTAYTLVAGTVNEYTARFAFDAEWDSYQRIAVFSSDGVEREQMLTDDACDVPWEVLRPGAYLKVGVYGTRDGQRLPTIWTAHRQYIHDGAGPTEEAAAPSPVLAEQMLQRMGDLGQLQTEDKSSLVAAINEVRETGGGGGTSDHSKLKNRDAADQHPISAITGLADALAGKQQAGDYLTEEQDPTVPEWAKRPQKPSYTAQEVGALPATTKIPTALSELSEDATHRVVTDAEKAAWNAKSNFSGSYNDLTDKPVIPTVPVQSVNGKTGAVVLSADDVGALPESTVIPAPYTLPIASPTVLGGVKPVAKTDEMTQSVGVDAAGTLYTKAGSGGGGGIAGGYRVIADITTAEDVDLINITEDADGNAFSLYDMQIIMYAKAHTSNGIFILIPNGYWATNTFMHTVQFYTDWFSGHIAECHSGMGVFWGECVDKNVSSNSNYVDFSRGQNMLTSLKISGKIAAGSRIILVGR